MWLNTGESPGSWVPLEVAVSGIFDTRIFDSAIFDGRDEWNNIGIGSSLWARETIPEPEE